MEVFNLSVEYKTENGIKNRKTKKTNKSLIRCLLNLKLLTPTKMMLDTKKKNIEIPLVELNFQMAFKCDEIRLIETVLYHF